MPEPHDLPLDEIKEEIGAVMKREGVSNWCCMMATKTDDSCKTQWVGNAGYFTRFGLLSHSLMCMFASREDEEEETY